MSRAYKVRRSLPRFTVRTEDELLWLRLKYLGLGVFVGLVVVGLVSWVGRG